MYDFGGLLKQQNNPACTKNKTKSVSLHHVEVGHKTKDFKYHHAGTPAVSLWVVIPIDCLSMRVVDSVLEVEYLLASSEAL